MSPLLAFVFGVLNAEIFTLGLWWPLQKERTVKLYLEGAAAHLIVLASLGSMFAFLWHPDVGGIDLVVSLLPDALQGEWAKTAIPFTPRIGVLAGFLMNLQLGKLASAVSSRIPRAD